MLRADILRLGGAGLPRARSGPQGQGRVRRRPCEENTPQGTAFRNSGRSSGLPGSLGGTLGRHPYSWHYQTASGGHVRRRKTRLASNADRTFPLLPIWQAQGQSGWLRGSRCRLLQRAARVDRPGGHGAAGSPLCPATAPAGRRTVACTPASGAWQASDPGRGPPQTHTAGDTTPAAARRPCRSADWSCVPQDVRGGGTSRGAPHSGRDGDGQEAWLGDGGRCLRRSSGGQRFQLLPFCAPLSGTGAATAAEPASSGSAHPRTHRIPRFHSTQNAGEPTMNLIALQRALRQLRLRRTAAVLETRLRQAQAEAMAPIDLISCLVSDELTRRSERLLDRRRKQAAFRDPNKTLDNFDFSFNPKMNRSLVFELATAAFIDRREDALFLGPGGTGKSHLAQAIGQAAILQGHKVLYRQTHILLEEVTETTIEGRRKQYMESISSVALLIIDDFGMRKLPQTAAEDLLEIVMRSEERRVGKE